MPANSLEESGPPGADEMMAELAGAEIDRLLAEAEADSPSRPAVKKPLESAPITNAQTLSVDEPVKASGVTPSAIDEEELEEQKRAQAAILAGDGVEDSVEKLTATNVAAPAPVAIPPAPGPAMTSDEIDQLISQMDRPISDAALAAPRNDSEEKPADAPVLTTTHENPELPPTTSEEPPIQSQKVAIFPEDQPANVAATEHSPAAENPGSLDNEAYSDEGMKSRLEALQQEAVAEVREKSQAPVPSPAPAPIASPTPPRVAAIHDEDAEDSTPPILIRVLEWINAPFDWLPDALRDAAGKLAVVTLLNAAGVLLYIALFRRHPLGH